MAILALAMREAGTLTEDTLVATVMSNLGLRLAMAASGITAASRPRSATGTCWRSCAPAGSRSAASRAATSCCPAYATTGDGVLTGAAPDGPDGRRPASRWPSWPR